MNVHGKFLQEIAGVPENSSDPDSVTPPYLCD